jgi:hypothetical protein
MKNELLGPTSLASLAKVKVFPTNKAPSGPSPEPSALGEGMRGLFVHGRIPKGKSIKPDRQAR